ncbi:uncharacterized protein LOC124466800 [Hypomesus transpacificus]|uniref:uncharacterized protein LOC124466800 n=1 Tax=Hypomesus transpacificus TaxID=137520 RepID=UPI001F086BFB|nr:uncharacterized protein LOC124466800 [Hypomesus transpacificus]
MKLTTVAVFGTLFCTVLSVPLKVNEEKTAFFGEDVHIVVPLLDGADVLFKPSSDPDSVVFLMREGRVESSRAQLNALNHLILEDVGEEDEGTYVIKNIQNPADVRHMVLIVRDCSLEQVVKYGDMYSVPVNGIESPITLEFRPSHTQANQTTEPPVVVLLNQSVTPAENYQSRLSVTDKKVTLNHVRGSDEGSFTILDKDGKVRKRTCLNVREHQTFVHLSYATTFKMNLYLDHTKVTLKYTPESDHEERTIVDQGLVVDPVDPGLDGRLTVEGSMIILERVRARDSGWFTVTDLTGFSVATIHLTVEAYKLPTLYVAILSLLGLLAFLLLVCLLSCLFKVRQRTEKARKIALIAQQAGKGDGDAFRHVVQEAYNKFTEESTSQSTWDNPTESTEVTIKGLEVSKGGRYHTFSDKNFLEMSDSGVEFNSAALPLDSDTDVPHTYNFHLDSDSIAATVVAEGDLSANQNNDSATSTIGSPAAQPDAAPDGDLMGTATPENTPRRGDLEAGSPKATEVVDEAPAPEAGDQAAAEST